MILQTGSPSGPLCERRSQLIRHDRIVRGVPSWIPLSRFGHGVGAQSAGITKPVAPEAQTPHKPPIRLARLNTNATRLGTLSLPDLCPSARIQWSRIFFVSPESLDHPATSNHTHAAHPSSQTADRRWISARNKHT